MDNKLLQNRKYLLVILLILVSLLIFIFVSPLLKPKENILIIDNLSESIDNLTEYHKNDLQSTLYRYIENQNQVNNIASEKIYHGVIREGTVETSILNYDETNIYLANFILDIPELKYSYETSINWMLEEMKEDTILDLPPAKIYCLSNKNSIYPDFHCEQNPAISIKLDPIMSLDLVINQDCWMSPFSSVESKSGYGIDILYHPTDDDYQNDTIESSYNTCVKSAKEYLTSNGLNLNDYKIRSEIKYFYNY